MYNLFARELGLPPRGLSQRVTRREFVDPGETFTFFQETGPGCISHWWLTYTPIRDPGVRDRAHDLQIRFFYDDSDTPDIDVTLAQYFAILLGQDIYPVDSAPLKVLPKNAVNSYLPIPFQSLRIELQNNSATQTCIWYMADWQSYAGIDLTPLRLNLVHTLESPADPLGSMLMADLAGEGFVAGMTKAVRVLDRADAWFHTGGDLWLLDGETAPRALRGIGGEDIFNMSFGIWEAQTDWVGAPFLKRASEDTALGSGYEGAMYRFFGPDPIWFDTSAVVRFGTRANHLETVVYAYLNPGPAPGVLTPSTWHLAGPFDCPDRDAFSKTEWADAPPSEWPNTWTADFQRYLVEDAPTTFQIPAEAVSEHGWCDFARHFRGRGRTNEGTQPVDVAAYAVGTVTISTPGTYTLSLGFDDTLAAWIDGEKIFTGTHDSGFAVQKIPVELPSGDQEIRIKLDNRNNAQWRLWAFCLTLDRDV